MQEPYIQDQIHRAKSLSLSRIGRGFFQPNHGRCAIQIGNATNFRRRIANQIGNGWLGCDWSTSQEMYLVMPARPVVRVLISGWHELQSEVTYNKTREKKNMQMTNHRCNFLKNRPWIGSIKDGPPFPWDNPQKDLSNILLKNSDDIFFHHGSKFYFCGGYYGLL